MHVPHINWPASAAEAVALQQSLRQRVRIEDNHTHFHHIAGIDVSYDIANNLSRAVIVVMDAATLEPIARPVATQMDTTFPYIPGLLSFREIPVIIKALSLLEAVPDLLMVDGHGIAHPRRLGIAAHLGVLLDMPSIGVAKKKLVGSYEEPAISKGATSVLMHKGEQIGTVLRSKNKVKPLFISPGHHMSHARAVAITQACLLKHKLPEPTRIADKISKQPGDYLR